MPIEEAKALAATAIMTTRQKGEFVVQRLDAGGDLYIVVEGQLIANRYSLAGREVGVRRIGTGGYFGAIAAVDRRPQTANVVALTTARIGQIPAPSVCRFLESSPPFARTLLEDLAESAREHRQRLFEMNSLTVSGRVDLEILRLAARAGISGNRAIIPLSGTHAEIASFVGGQREAVTREFSRLRRRRIITRVGRALHVLDIRALVEAAEEYGAEADDL